MKRRIKVWHLMYLVAGSAFLIVLLRWFNGYVSHFTTRIDDHVAAMRRVGAKDPITWVERSARQGEADAVEESDPALAARFAGKAALDRRILDRLRDEQRPPSIAARLGVLALALGLLAGIIVLTNWFVRRQRRNLTLSR